MIDLHCHILPELDDGSQSIRQSLEMARMALDCGVTTIVATPHCIDDRTREIHAALSALRQALADYQLPLKLLPGMEIFGTPDTARLLKEGRLLTLAGSNHPLIEFSFDSSGEEETRILGSVLDAGYQPLVAHPERYAYVQHNPELMNQWKKMGCLFQVNRGSLLGRFGSRAQEMSFALVERGFATVVASDAHSHRFRTPWMQDVREFLSHRFSPAAAQYLLLRNPRSILADKPLPPLDPDWF